MQIEASVNSRCWKRGGAKAIAKANGKQASLTDIVGRIRLDAQNAADVNLLICLYRHVFGYGERKGSILVRDSDGNDVLTYGYQLENPVVDEIAETRKGFENGV